MKVAFWNERGLGRRGKGEMVKDWCRRNALRVMGIVETKKKGMSVSFVNRIWGSDDIGWDAAAVDECLGVSMNLGEYKDTEHIFLDDDNDEFDDEFGEKLDDGFDNFPTDSKGKTCSDLTMIPSKNKKS
ncbi:hypothetical protein PIB30_014338 [Stylosanthes scabra]|uniref:Uncharacterized protein n=1 Tax=Stylosanthes scabra TaxID=79078 RepID=A0ABU6R6P9_9FABA|nr:hypothetical protein [Stylosanthes scabra]